MSPDLSSGFDLPGSFWIQVNLDQDQSWSRMPFNFFLLQIFYFSFQIIPNEFLCKKNDFFGSWSHPAPPQGKFLTKNFNFYQNFLSLKMVWNEFLGKNYVVFFCTPPYLAPPQGIFDKKFVNFYQICLSLKMIWNELLSKNYDFVSTAFHPAPPAWIFLDPGQSGSRSILIQDGIQIFLLQFFHFSFQIIPNEFLCKNFDFLVPHPILSHPRGNFWPQKINFLPKNF